MAEVRSRKVGKILRLEARAQKILARYETHHARGEPWKRKGKALLDKARAMELTLTGGQLGELRRARGGP
ncbi:MAG: hypothetical protein HY726_00645 [Candidatus Rokubacteria bacterium]|nr:hypothetical protein [Candidatus Rokubacteria bacterium]